MQQIKGQVEGTGHNFIAVSWSPDGRWVAFDGPANDLCVVAVADGAVKCFKGYLSDVGALPAWSPASDAILVSSNRIGQILMGDADLQWDLFIVGIPGGEVTRITNSRDQEQAVVWGR
jgi:Tol biopolymer transport system component